MPPTILPFENYKTFIYQSYIIHDLSVKQVLEALETQGLKCSRAAFMKKISEWKFQKNARFQKDENTSILRVKIAYLATTRALSDKKIHQVRYFNMLQYCIDLLIIICSAKILEKKGHIVTSRKLAEIRRSMNFHHRIKPENIFSAIHLLREIIQHELEQGNIILSERRSVWLHLRQLGILASE